MNRECRNCAFAELPEPRTKESEVVLCHHPKREPQLLKHFDEACRYWRAYTEKERETVIPAGAAMVSVPWDWVRRIEKLEGTVEFHDKRTHEHRAEDDLWDRVEALEEKVEAHTVAGPPTVNKPDGHSSRWVNGHYLDELRSRIAKLESRRCPPAAPGSPCD